MSRVRKDVLNDLVHFDGSLSDIIKELLLYPFDNEDNIVTLKNMDILNVLSRYVEGIFTSQDIYNWAEMIEGREDIGYEAGYEDVLKNFIFELANHEINYELNIERAKELIEKLKKNNYCG